MTQDEPKVTVTNSLGSNHIVNNMPATQTIKAYEAPALKIVVPPDAQVKPVSQISFEKQSEQGAQNLQEMPTAAEAAAGQEEAKSTPAERRDAMKRANQEHQKAIQMQKEATALRQEASNFEELKKNAATNPVALAKALGMDPTEFLRRFQNEMFSIPNEEIKKEPPTVDERLQSYEQERQAERAAAANYQSEMTRMNYINTKILPAIKGDTEKYQLLNHNNVETSAGFIYDMMNDHFKRTGEELNAEDVAEEMENQLMNEFEEKINSVRKIGKFSKHFKTLEEETSPLTATTSDLGAKKEWTGAKSPVPVAGLSRDKRSRLERLKKL